MDFELIGHELIKTFKASKDDLWFFGRNIQSENLEYSLKLDSITPELISRWAKNFPAGSYFSVSKESNQTRLTLIISISDNDYDNIFKLKYSQIKLSKLGIIENTDATLLEILESKIE